MYHHFWNDGERLRGPGTYYHTSAKEKDEKGEPIAALVDCWICAPLEVLAITATREDNEYGRLVEFTSLNERKKRCAIPARWFAGRGDEPWANCSPWDWRSPWQSRACLGFFIILPIPSPRNVSQLRFPLAGMTRKPLFCPTKSSARQQFGIRARTNESLHQSREVSRWKAQVAAWAQGNPNLIVAFAALFAGPLFHVFNVPGGGLNWFGHTTHGKTSCLEGGAVGLGRTENFSRTWNSTAIGLEAMAQLHTDTALILDEIHMVDPKVLDSIIYALMNGFGRARAMSMELRGQRPAGVCSCFPVGRFPAKPSLPTGGMKSGRDRLSGCWTFRLRASMALSTDLHGFKGGAEFADALRESAGQHYGHAGPRFVRCVD